MNDYKISFFVNPYVLRILLIILILSYVKKQFVDSVRNNKNNYYNPSSNT